MANGVDLEPGLITTSRTHRHITPKQMYILVLLVLHYDSFLSTTPKAFIIGENLTAVSANSLSGSESFTIPHRQITWFGFVLLTLSVLLQ